MTWPTIGLHEACRPKQWPTISVSELLPEGYPVYGANGKIGFYSTFTHTQPTVLVTCRGATCGNVNICEPSSYVTGNAMALDDLDSRLHLSFVAHYLRYRGLNDAISGSAQPQITRESLKKVRLPLPPLAEQQRISAILDQAEALQAKRRQALAKLDTLTQSVFLEMFGDDSSEQKSLAEVVRVGTIVTYGIVQAGAEVVGGVPYIRTGDIKDGLIDTQYLRHTAPEIAERFQRSRVSEGDLVISIRATVGTVARVTTELDGANLT